MIECNEINPYYVYRHQRLNTFEIFYVGISNSGSGAISVDTICS